eukprot:Skav203911  [mRNA]  locus=scaffold228:91730:92161:+ [translate_table: standard]
MEQELGRVEVTCVGVPTRAPERAVAKKLLQRASNFRHGIKGHLKTIIWHLKEEEKQLRVKAKMSSQSRPGHHLQLANPQTPTSLGDFSETEMAPLGEVPKSLVLDLVADEASPGDTNSEESPAVEASPAPLADLNGEVMDFID